MGFTDTITRAAVLGDLRKNAGRRGVAVAELEASRQQLADLLRKGRARHVPVTKMCEAAGINRERAYELLRRADVPKPRETYINEGGTE